MKKSILLTIVPALLLSSCTLPDFVNSFLGKNNEVQEEAKKEEKQYPNSVLNSEWGLEAAKASYDALGLAIPYIENKGFDYKPGVDDYGDPDIWFYVYFDSDVESEEAFTNYVTICESKGFSGSVQTTTYVDYETYTWYEFEVCYCDRVIYDATGTKQFGVELQFLVSYYNEKPCLGIYGFTYVYCPSDEFPTAALDKLYGEGKHDSIPEISLEGYEYGFQFGLLDNNDMYLVVNIYNASYEIEELYYEALKAIGIYQIGWSNDSLDTAYLADEYQGYYDENYYIAISDTAYIYFDYDLSSSTFIIEFYK